MYTRLIVLLMVGACASSKPMSPKSKPAPANADGLSTFTLPKTGTLSGTTMAMAQPVASDNGLVYLIPMHQGLPPMTCSAAPEDRNTPDILRTLAQKMTQLGDEPADTQQIRARMTANGLPYLTALSAAYKQGKVLSMFRIAAVVGLGQFAFCVGYEPNPTSTIIDEAQAAFFDGLLVQGRPLDRNTDNVSLMNIKMPNGWEPAASISHRIVLKTDTIQKFQYMNAFLGHTNQGDMSIFTNDSIITPKSNEPLAGKDISSVNNAPASESTYLVLPDRLFAMLVSTEGEKETKIAFKAPFKGEDEVDRWLQTAKAGAALEFGFVLGTDAAVGKVSVMTRQGDDLQVAVDWGSRKGEGRFHVQHGWLDFRGTLSGAPMTIVWPFALAKTKAP